MKGAIMTSGGSGTGKLFAAIQAKFPAGSTCTATNGTKTLTAKGESNIFLFAIPEPKTLPESWTITAKEGLTEKSETVEITSVGQMISVEIVFREILFKSGTNKMALGFRGSYDSGTASLSVGNTIKLSTQQNGAISYLSEDKIDLTNFTTLKCTNVASSGNAYLVIDTGKSANPAESTSFVAKTTDNSLSVAAYSGEYYVGIACGLSSSKEISELWLE